MLTAKLAEVLDVMVAIHEDGGRITRQDIAQAMDVNKMTARDYCEQLAARGYIAKWRPHMTYIYKPLYDADGRRIAAAHEGEVDANGIVKCPPRYAAGYAPNAPKGLADYEGRKN